MKQLQALQVSKKQSERPRSSQRKLICWCCEEEGHAIRNCPVAQQIKTAYKQKDDKKIVSNGTKGCQMMQKGARGCQMFPESCPTVPKGASGYQMVPESTKGCHRVPNGAGGYQLVPECARVCQSGPIGTVMAPRLGKASRGCQMFPESCPRVPKGASGYQMVPESTKGCHRVPDGAGGYQLVPECARVCQSGPIGRVVAPELGKASDLIFVTVSIAGVEVVALVDTGATISCCRWEWYLKWQDRLGGVIKSKVRIIGVDSNPIKIKGLTRPLTLHWDGVGGKCQLKILTSLTDVDVVVGMDVLRQFDVEIDFKKQIARPAREPCTPLEPTRTIGLLLDNPDFTFKGKIPVKEEGVEEVAKGIGRPWYRGVQRVWMTSSSKKKKEDQKTRKETIG